MKVGTKVGAKRWAYSAAHPDCWLKPWAGVVLAKDDPRAWADTLAFRGTPTQEQVRAHIAAIGPGGLASVTPVLWDFGPHGQKVYWETTAGLRPYADDVAEWADARVERRAELAGLRLVGLQRVG